MVLVEDHEVKGLLGPRGLEGPSSPKARDLDGLPLSIRSQGLYTIPRVTLWGPVGVPLAVRALIAHAWPALPPIASLSLSLAPHLSGRSPGPRPQGSPLVQARPPYTSSQAPITFTRVNLWRALWGRALWGSTKSCMASPRASPGSRRSRCTHKTSRPGLGHRTPRPLQHCHAAPSDRISSPTSRGVQTFGEASRTTRASVPL